ncbi:MAG: YicC/YloC family endoribonuclease [Gemmatimonadaceae bacterium]|nr:YicC/YloC family endoribonuclease [Gemmatimonadaceae bacterium]
MTGFGSAEGPVGGTTVGVELRTVNHRFFNPNLKLPGRFARFEADVREALRKRVARGHIACTVRIVRDGESMPVRIDAERFGAFVAQLRELQRAHGLVGDVDVATVARMPGLIVDAGAEDEDAGTVEEMLAVVEAAITALNEMRAQEGARLATVLHERLGLMETAMARVAARAPERLVAQRDRLRASVQELAGGVAVSEDRLAQEIAVLADRLDVHEELDRFRSHLTAFRDALNDTSGEAVGKRLGFLVQELLREANTTGSKANDAAIAREVITVKEELERVREQVENLE